MKISNRVYNKIILGSSVALGLVVALPVFAVLMTGTKSGGSDVTITTSNAPVELSEKSGNQVFTTIKAMPCDSDADGNMMYGSAPCRKFIQAERVNFQDYGHRAQWYELMFILTVMMVWAVLLLLIGVLWKQLKKHKSN